MKKIYISFAVIAMAIVFQSSVNFSSQPPTGYTGDQGDHCNSCHSSFALNSGGGSVTTAGLPAGSFTAGQAYNFSLTIAHGTTDRRRWGFSIKAVNSAGDAVGTFSSTNTNAAVNGDELSHFSAVTTGLQNSFTYNNLRWTAPAAPGPNDNQVTFYYVGNAANNANGNQGDYIYSNTLNVALPLELKDIRISTAHNVISLHWQTLTETNTKAFVIEKSDDAVSYYTAGTVNAAGNSTTLRNYSFTDDHPSYYDRPLYYRLKMIDKDGSFRYSTVLSARLQPKADYVKHVWPTIISKGNTVNATILSTTDQQATIQLTDITGRKLESFRLQLKSGMNTIRFTPQANMNAGVVLATIHGTTIHQTVSLLVQ
jgi:hypothetical protein